MNQLGSVVIQRYLPACWVPMHLKVSIVLRVRNDDINMSVDVLFHRKKQLVKLTLSSKTYVFEDKLTKFSSI